MNVTLNARLQNGLLFQGGFGTGRQVTNDCDVVDDLPEMLHTFFGDPTRAFFFAARPPSSASRTTGGAPRSRAWSRYTIPKIDVQISATFQNLPGAVVQSNANYGVIPGVAGPGPFIPFQTFQIVNPGELYVERLNQIDLRLSKLLRFGTHADDDQLRLLQRHERQLGAQRELRISGRRGADGDPTSILLPRLFKFSAQFDF